MGRLRQVTWLGAALAVVACSGDGTGVDGNGGNGAAPTFSGEVQPIFTNRCALSGCHIGSNAPPPGKPMDLSAGQAFGNIVNVSSIQVDSLLRVRAGSPDRSYLVFKIEGRAGSVGGENTRMPLGMSPLSQDQINTIRAWIAAGAQNN